MKKLTILACALAALPLCAETWYFTGTGKHWYSGTSDWGCGWGYTGADANWTNALGEAGAPVAGDTAILPAKNIKICGGPWNSSDAIETFITQGPFCLMQWSLYMRPGGQGVVIGGTGSETWWGGISLQPNPDSDVTEVVMTVPANKTVNIQKGVECNGLAFVKDGAGALNVHCQGLGNYARLNNATIKLRGGTFIDCHTACYTGARLVFDSNDASACVRLGALDGKAPQNWGVKNGAIEETDAVQNTGHGFTSADTAFSYLFTVSGAPTVNPMRFTGTFSKRAGFVWNPDSSDAVFEFAKGVSTTAGDLHVSNGVVRVTEGATFTSLSNLVVGAGASLVFTAGAGDGFMAQDVEILAGGTVSVGRGRIVTFNSAIVGGTALAPGFHTSATDPAWLTGEGHVYVPGGASATTTSATWTGAGDDTLLTTAANWEGAAAPDFTTGGLVATFGTGGDRATFAGADVAQFAGLAVTRPFTFATADNTDGLVALGAQGLTLSADATAVELAWPLTLLAPQTWTVATGATLHVTGNLSGFSGADTVTVDGPGTITFSGAKTFPNNMILTNGVIHFVGDGAMGGAVGTTEADFSRAKIYFDGGVNVRSLELYTPEEYQPVFFTAGTTNRFEGLFWYNTKRGGKNNCKMIFSDNTETVFAGGLKGNYFSLWGTASAHVIVTNEPVTCSDRFCFDSPQTWDFYVTGNQLSGNKSFWNDGTVRTHLPYVLAATWSNGTESRIQFSKNMTLDLCGNDQAIGILQGSSGTVTSAAPAFLHLAQNHTPPNYDGDIQVGITNKLVFKGGAGLSLDAVNDEMAAKIPHVLVSTSSTTGTLQVTRGRLTLAAPNGSWTNATKAVVTGGTLVLEHGQALGRDTDVYIEGEAGQIEIPAGVVQKVRDLYIDGVRQSPTSYGSATSPAKRHDAVHFAGDGVLNVLSDGQGFTFFLR